MEREEILPAKHNSKDFLSMDSYKEKDSAQSKWIKISTSTLEISKMAKGTGRVFKNTKIQSLTETSWTTRKQEREL
jgi:exosome complex RNA-binding protein Rrp42 (RNase PH superfamily)